MTPDNFIKCLKTFVNDGTIKITSKNFHKVLKILVDDETITDKDFKSIVHTLSRMKSK